MDQDGAREEPVGGSVYERLRADIVSGAEAPGAHLGEAALAERYGVSPVSYTHLTLPTSVLMCRSRWSPYH